MTDTPGPAAGETFRLTMPVRVLDPEGNVVSEYEGVSLVAASDVNDPELLARLRAAVARGRPLETEE